MKKIYMKPDMMVVELRSHQPLLAGSGPVRGRDVHEEDANGGYETL